MNCEKYLNLIHDLVEGELDEQNAEQINLHIFNCSECKSLFEMLKHEKEIYSRYLFEIEPPTNLLAQFQTRLEIEEQKSFSAVKSSIGFPQSISNLLAFLRSNPAQTIAMTSVLFILGFGLFSFLKTESSLENKESLQATTTSPQLILPKIDKGENHPVEIPEKDVDETKTSVKEVSNIISTKQVAKKKTEPKVEVKQESSNTFDEEQNHIKEIQNLEIAATKQLEKIELLLRSVRNAQAIDDSDAYDLSYEKQQARKLLDANFELRQKAQIYGTLFTEEMLGKVEPYLLEIANLENTPSADKVLEIKERVRNQNIIASLQGF